MIMAGLVTDGNGRLDVGTANGREDRWGKKENKKKVAVVVVVCQLPPREAGRVRVTQRNQGQDKNPRSSASDLNGLSVDW